MSVFRHWKGIAIAVAIPLLAYLFLFNYVEQGEAGIGWNPISGEVFLQNPGTHFTGPLTMVTIAETRPQRLCLTSSAHSAPNCRLIQFQPEQYREFIEVEGWSYFWLANRFSFNSGYDETYRGFRDILRGYGFSAQPYPFVKVLKAQ